MVVPNFPDSEVTSLQAMVERVRHAHYRVIWIAGGTSAMRSLFLNQLVNQFECPLIDVGRQLSSNLMDQSASLRAASAEEAFYDLLAASRGEMLCLDHLDILFDETLMLKAVDLVRNASRRYVLLASWPGAVDQSSLVFGPPDHPSYFRIPLSELECPVHNLSIL